jgi:hypothetical protein
MREKAVNSLIVFPPNNKKFFYLGESSTIKIIFPAYRTKLVFCSTENKTAEDHTAMNKRLHTFGWYRFLLKGDKPPLVS